MKLANKQLKQGPVNLDLDKVIEANLKLRETPIREVQKSNGSKQKQPLNKKSELIRVQLDFPQERIEELNEVMKDVGLETRKDLFNNALSIFVWAVNEKKKGNTIFAASEETNSIKELVMHPLEMAATKFRKRS